MGLDAQIIGIGPFSSRIVEALEYPADFYASVPTGATVITLVFEALTSEQSHTLARCFRVGAMELGRHVLNASVADIESLRAEFDSQEVDHFELLRDASFQFYYMPNA